MSSRAKFCLVFVALGALAANAAPINSAQKNSKFQPGKSRAIGKAQIVKPASAAAPLVQKTWYGVQIRKIEAEPQAGSKVEVNGFVFNRADEAPAATKAPVKTSATRR